MAHFAPSLPDLALQVINHLHPNLMVQIAYLPAKDCVGDDGASADGFTLFPDDSADPQIWISDAIPILGVPDVMFHEMAHVVAGMDADHGKEWDGIYQALWAEMDAQVARRKDQ